MQIKSEKEFKKKNKTNKCQDISIQKVKMHSEQRNTYKMRKTYRL